MKWKLQVIIHHNQQIFYGPLFQDFNEGGWTYIFSQMDGHMLFKKQLSCALLEMMRPPCLSLIFLTSSQLPFGLYYSFWFRYPFNLHIHHKNHPSIISINWHYLFVLFFIYKTNSRTYNASLLRFTHRNIFLVLQNKVN